MSSSNLYSDSHESRNFTTFVSDMSSSSSLPMSPCSSPIAANKYTSASWGISLTGLLSLSDMFTDLSFGMQDVRRAILKETVRHPSTCFTGAFVELLPNTSLYRGEPQFFVSYDSRVRFCDFLSAIMDFDDNERSKRQSSTMDHTQANNSSVPIYYFVELFVHSQHIVKGPDYWVKFLETSTTQIGRTLVILDDIEQPCICINAWCALEIGSTYATKRVVDPESQAAAPSSLSDDSSSLSSVASVDSSCGDDKKEEEEEVVQIIFPRRVRERLHRRIQQESQTSSIPGSCCTPMAYSNVYPSVYSLHQWDFRQTGAYHAACKELKIACTEEKRGHGKTLRDICTVTTHRIHAIISGRIGFAYLNQQFNQAIRTALDRSIHALLNGSESLFGVSSRVYDGTYDYESVVFQDTDDRFGGTDDDRGILSSLLPGEGIHEEFLNNFKFDTVNYPDIDDDDEYYSNSDVDYECEYEFIHQRFDNVRSSPKTKAVSKSPSVVLSSPEIDQTNSSSIRTLSFVPKDRNNVKFSTYRYQQNMINSFLTL